DTRDSGGKIDLVVLSHVDADHVVGLLDLLKELVEQRRENQSETITIEGLWHNSFGQTLGPAVERNLERQMRGSILPRGEMPVAEFQERSIAQGHELTALARGLKIPINVHFRNTPDRLVCVENMDVPFEFGNLKVTIVGPTKTTLKELQDEWEDWLDKQKKVEATTTDAEADARALDKSVPNLSSIMLLVEGDGKTVLLTGDGRGDHLEQGMRQAGVLNPDGTLHVDVFKLPHHGSNANVTADFFERITANTYLICADGSNDNPDFQTLEWLVQAVAKQGRQFHIVATTETPSIKKLVAQYDPDEFNYSLVFIEDGEHFVTIDLAKVPSQKGEDLTDINGIGPVFNGRLQQAGITTRAQLLALTPEELAAILQTNQKRAENILQAARS
ncbi:MAG: helix-hairpin-helix domain-containing protein, partial [Candidatus Promineifilaceae bacterium]